MYWWYIYQSNDIDVECRQRKQVFAFDISGIGNNLERYNYIKIIFKQNHDEKDENKPQFCVNEFGIYGYKTM